MIQVNSQTMREIVPLYKGAAGNAQKTIIDAVGPYLVEVLPLYKIDTRLRIAHFLAQCAHESDGFRTLEEYATGAAYEGRADLGNTKRGDGKRYKGRAPIELTGRANYRRVGTILSIDLENNPTWASLPANALKISCVFWTDKNINAKADLDDLIGVTHMVNGGENGLDQRRAYLVKAKIAVAKAMAGLIDRSPDFPLPTLHRGTTASAVSTLQQALQKSGWAVTIDGDFGAATELAVRTFQFYHGLPVDGIVGPATWAKLDVRVGDPT